MEHAAKHAVIARLFSLAAVLMLFTLLFIVELVGKYATKTFCADR